MSFASLHADDEKPTLGWKNGDQLKGEILEGDGETITWKASPFRDPFSIQQEHLKQILFPEKKKEDDGSSHDFRFILSNGDRIFGDLISIDGSTVVIKSERFPDLLSLSRSHIDRIEQVSGSRVKFAGPVDLGKWTPIGRNRKIEDWQMGIRGDFMTHEWHAGLFRPIDFPNTVEISFALETPGKIPNFEISLVRDGEKGPRIETWGKTVVLTNGSKFASLFKVGPEKKEIRLRIFWNQSSGELKACDASGNLLAELDGVKIKFPASGANRRSNDEMIRGFGLINRTPHLRLTQVNVRDWNGEEIPVIDVNQPRIEMASGDTYLGLNRLSVSNGSNKLSINGRALALDSVSEIIFSTNQNILEEGKILASAHVAWHDGSSISGDLKTLKDNRVSLATDWNANPVMANLAAAKQILFPSLDTESDNQLDTLTTGEMTIHGRVQGGTKENPPSSLVAWRPVGSENASPLDSGIFAEVVRGAFAAGLPVVTSARLYLTNGEMVVGRLISITEKEVNFSSDATGQISVDHSNIRAIDIGGEKINLNGFSDKGWQVFSEEEKAVEMTDDTVVLRSDGFGHPNLLMGDRIQFEGDWKQSYGAMTLRVFCASNDPNSASTDVILAAQGNRMFVGKLRKGGAFSFSGEQVPIRDNKASFEILARPDKVEIKVNGKSALTIPVEEDKVSGNGLFFRMGGGWQGWNNDDNEITISNFSVERTPGYVPSRVIDTDAKKNALKIPRFHRDNPPKHLLIAPNGDLLRGNLLSLSGNKVRFSSRENTFDLPRNRVSSIVWLREKPGTLKPGEDPISKKEEAEYAKKEADPAIEKVKDFKVSHQFMLHDGSRLKLAMKAIDGEEFSGESALLGQCKVTLQQVKEMKVGPAATVDSKTDKSADLFAFENWTIEYTPDPAIPNGEGQASSPLVGKPAPDFTLTMSDESKFKLSEKKGKVVVLDFWATWCGPCVRAMPDVKAAVNAFPEDKGVTLCAVNQAESMEVVEQFFETRGWENIPVAFDFAMTVSKEYGVKGIPHTVVVGKDGNVAWTHSGYTDNLKADLAKAIATELAK